MFKNNHFTDKKMSLAAQKEKLLQEFKYYEQRIKEFPSQNSSVNFSGYNSSDSEDDTPRLLNPHPPRSELRRQERQLSVYLQATRELTSLEVLESEVSLMPQAPVLDGEPPVLEVGSWREVSAECRINFVPFSITFYTHQPSRKFAPSSFRGLKVVPVKKSHEVELSKSLLSSLTRPSDAVDVMRSYSIAYRSRRTTLARLADKYANSLFMELLEEGGFVLKCANILEMAWRLENKSSALASLRHKMSFNLEYMDESHLKVIKHAYKQLSNPSLQTDERTQLLSKIISTCLEAQTAKETSESMESDTESVRRLEKTTLDDHNEDNEPESNENRQHDEINRDKEVMAPPKSLPKKGKPKGKENKGDNRTSVKRSSEAVTNICKKARTENERSEVDGSKETVVAKQISKDNVTSILNLDEIAVKNQNVIAKVMKPNKNKATNNSESIKNTDKIIEDSSKITKNKDIQDGKLKSNEQTKKVADKISKNDQISSSNNENDANPAQSKKNKVAKSSDSQKVENPAKHLNKGTVGANRKVVQSDNNTENHKDASPPKENEANATKLNKNLEKNRDASNKKVANEKNTNIKEQDNKNSEKNNNVANKNEQIKKTQQNLNEKSEPPKDAKAQNKGIKEQSNPKPVKRKIDASTVANAKKLNSGPQNAKSDKNTDLNTIANSNTNSKAKEKNNTKQPDSETKPESYKKNINAAANAKKNVNSDPQTKKNKNSAIAKNDTDSNITHSSEANNVDNQKSNTVPQSSKTITAKTITAKNKEQVTKTTISDPPKDTEKDLKTKDSNLKNLNKETATQNKDSNLKNLNKETAKQNKDSNLKNLNKETATQNKDSNLKNLNKETAKQNKDSNLKNLNKETAKQNKDSNLKYPNKETAKQTKITKQTGTLKNVKLSNIKDKAQGKPRNAITTLTHRNSLSKGNKPIVKLNAKNISRIPQKKLSPAYAAVLKQNPLRISPRGMSKFKSSSDSNIQANIFKPVTNIPRLLKKPTASR